MSQTLAPTGGLDPTLFAGVLGIIQPQAPDDLQEVAVTDDLDGEGETVPGLKFGDSSLDARHVEDLLRTVNDVSKGVSERTHDEYRRYVLSPSRSCSLLTSMPHLPSRLIAQCEEFLIQRQLVSPGQFFCDTPPEHAPQYIVIWIMNESVCFHFLKHRILIV
jgi:hypothetical protein